MRGLVGVIAGACMALVVACAVKQHAGAPAPVHSEAPAGPMMPQDPHAQIEQFGREIADARTKIGLSAEVTGPIAPCPGGQCSSQPAAMSAHADPACHPASSDTCSSTCTLADSICDNATKICDLAKQLAGDTWASDRCASASTSCHDAHERCCGCQ